MFKCFVNEHDNDCTNCLQIIDRIDNDEKWFYFVVEFNDEFINRNIVEQSLEIDV
jgi:disulfide oxidoreductase YuzD